MKLIIENNTQSFANSASEITDVLATIQKILKEENLELSHLIIDGVAVYLDYEAYLNDHIETVKEIVVETQQLKPLIEDTLGSAFNYISNATTILKALAEAFYQAPRPDTWNSLADLFEGIGWLLNTMNRIDQIEQLNQYVQNYDIWNEYVQIVKGLNVLLPELEQAMVNRDHVLIGDLILYEISPIFEAAEDKLRFFVPAGGQYVS